MLSSPPMPGADKSSTITSGCFPNTPDRLVCSVQLRLSILSRQQYSKTSTHNGMIVCQYNFNSFFHFNGIFYDDANALLGSGLNSQFAAQDVEPFSHA